ncbi:MAG: sialate O-acetylesterase, partial [archaeon]
SANCYIGRYASGHYWNGTIDEAFIFNRSLSQEEIQSLYNTSQYQYNHDFAGLELGDHTFEGHGVNGAGTKASAGLRTVTIISSAPAEVTSVVYPLQHTIIQRETETAGDISIRGTVDSLVPVGILARFSGDSMWTPIATSSWDGTFVGTLENVPVRQGTLEVKTSEGSNIILVNNIGVGDVFVVAGQSNAEGRGQHNNNLFVDNPYDATVYREDDIWKIANDPTDSDTLLGSVWPLVANNITQNQSVPVAFITVADGSKSIAEWQKDYAGGVNCSENVRCYQNMINQITEATNGSMKIKAILFFQGEKDVNSGGGVYAYYKTELIQFASDVIGDTELAESVVVGQIASGQHGDPEPIINYPALNSIRRAQQDAWDESSNISAGPVTYDITLGDGGVHFYTDEEIATFAERWWASIEDAIYGDTDGVSGRGPQINSVKMYDTSVGELVLEFNNTDTIVIENFTGGDNSPVDAEGFRGWEGATNFSDDNVTLISLSGNELTISVDAITWNNSANISLGYALDGQGKFLVRDAVSKLPAEFFVDMSVTYLETYPVFSEFFDNSDTLVGSGTAVFNVTVRNTNGTVFLRINGLNYSATNLTAEVYNASVDLTDSGVYSYSWASWAEGENGNYGESEIRYYTVGAVQNDDDDDDNDDDSPGGGGSDLVYWPSFDQLGQGYERTLREAEKIKFYFDGDLHQVMLNDIINGGSALITVSSTPATFNLSLGQIKKVDLNGDNYYDLSVFVEGITSTRVNLIVKFIYELIPTDGETDPDLLIGDSDCEELWQCGTWESCDNGQEMRVCEDIRECGTKENKPETVRTCSSDFFGSVRYDILFAGIMVVIGAVGIVVLIIFRKSFLRKPMDEKQVE